MATKKAPQTRAVRAGVDTDRQFGAVMPPIYLSTNFAFAGFAEARQYDYTRTANPTRDLLAEALADLEGGAGATVTATGMAAVALVCQLLKPGELVVGPRDCYGGTFRLLTRLAARGLFRLDLVDLADASALEEAAGQRPRLVWVESPTNPLLRVMDLAAIRAQFPSGESLICVDNTFLSPALQQPLRFGADLVVHSTTKYLNGHSDVVGGAVVAATAELHAQMQDWSNVLGVSGAPFDAYLTLRGLRTLHVRMRQHEANATAVATLLADHPRVERVYYPGLGSHPGHALAREQQRGFGGMLSLELAGGEPAARRFIAALRLFTLAESLGGVESLVCHPATMTHAAMDPDSRARAGIRPGLVRLSLGIEETKDLLADVGQALSASAAE